MKKYLFIFILFFPNISFSIDVPTVDDFNKEMSIIDNQLDENSNKKNKIPFRTFYVSHRNEETLGELFTFFILETILLGKLMNINPYDQPAVELIKKETKKNLIKS